MAGLFTVFSWAFVSFWSAIPGGIALDLSPLLVAVTATASYGCGTALVVFAGTPLRERIRRRIEKQAVPDGKQVPDRTRQWIQWAWSRFGLIGLAV